MLYKELAYDLKVEIKIKFSENNDCDIKTQTQEPGDDIRTGKFDIELNAEKCHGFYFSQVVSSLLDNLFFEIHDSRGRTNS